MELIPALISFDLKLINRMALIRVVYSQKQFGLKTFFFLFQNSKMFSLFEEEDVPSRKWSIIQKKKYFILMRKPCEVSPLTLKTFILFFVIKMTKKGQNKSPVIVTKIKALLFVQEQNLLSWWRLVSHPARLIGPHSSLAETKLHPDALSFNSAQCFSAASGPKVHLQGTNPLI